MNNLMSILQTLDQFDKWLFQKINGQWTNSFFDSIAPFLRQSNIWMPLYLFLFVFAALNFKKNGWWWILFFLCTVALTDMIGTRIFKHSFERLRPCSDPNFAASVRLIIGECAGGYSFISNHAANHFGLATFLYFTLRNHVGKWVIIAYLLAIAVGYSQIYVGVHYPFDVICGALLGLMTGLLTARFFNKKFGFANFDTQPTISP
jgi:membrane-associated phospholipid phosphatase